MKVEPPYCYCGKKTKMVEFGRVCYWYCVKCEIEVQSLTPPVGSLVECKDCGGRAAHDRDCVRLRKGRK